MPRPRLAISFLLGLCLLACGPAGRAWADFGDKQADRQALPQVPPGFEVTVFAAEPLVRQPCSLAFDARGRLYVGMGPQYRNPTPETPGDQVSMVLDTNGDGRADRIKTFATGFNAVQGLAWHGNDLWVANAPDLTVVRDLDGDDQADEYRVIYTDLGNLEHGLHGLQWAPDGKLYMSKGNSKGLTLPGRIAPKPFRELWGVTAPAGSPDFPEPKVYRKDEYQRAYHDPADDWGLDGGVLRCDDGGHNLEIVCRGFRNPWDIAFDSGFNWLGTDNDQVTGDRVFMPFFAAHFGWNHPWSSHWSAAPHPPTAPVSGPLFEGSGTGLVFGDSPTFPAAFRGVFFINDWLRKTTFVWRPVWDGALMRPQAGDWEPFIVGGNALYRPTDLEIGPDGALWVLGWSSGYGAEWKDGELTNEGRIFRIQWKGDANPTALASSSTGSSALPAPKLPWKDRSTAELIANFAGPLPVWQIDSQDELLRRGDAIKEPLLAALRHSDLTASQATWVAWTLGRLNLDDPSIDHYFSSLIDPTSAPNQDTNRQVQAVRILGYRLLYGQPQQERLQALNRALQHAEPRIRFAAAQAIGQFADHQRNAPQTDSAKPISTTFLRSLLDQLAKETDPTTFYASWQTLRRVSTPFELRELLDDSRAGVRRAVVLALCETRSFTRSELEAITAKERDPAVLELLQLWRTKVGDGTNNVVVRGRPIDPQPYAHLANDRTRTTAAIENPHGVVLVKDLQAKSQRNYRLVPGGFRTDTAIYTDRAYRLNTIPETLQGLDFIQTANDDDGSRGDQWLQMQAALPLRVYIGIDRRHAGPQWVRSQFQKTELVATIDEGAEFHLFVRDYPAGSLVLGGNTDNGQAGGKGNYLIAFEPIPFPQRTSATTADEVLAVLAQGDAQRGAILFQHPRAAGCVKCHRLDQARNAFGPNLGEIGSRAQPQHLIQSMLDPSAVITEGFTMQTIITDGGQTYAGVLLEESGLMVAIGLPTGERVEIPKSRIDERQTSRTSAMPSMAQTLTPQQVADLTAFLLSQKTSSKQPGESSAVPAANPSTSNKPAASSEPQDSRAQAEKTGQRVSPSSESPSRATSIAATKPRFSANEQPDRLVLFLDGQRIADYVFADTKTLRPYFSQVCTVSGLQVTRNHPPQPGLDATDHDTMHPGIWLGFGDLSGQDFWRNRGRIEHLRFVEPPRADGNQLHFTTESRMLTSAGEQLSSLTSRYTLYALPASWRLDWDATFRSEQNDFQFGDQEEMGFAARVATPLTEKNGGRITSSTGRHTAAATWGQPAAWCDYAGKIEGKSVGIMLIPSPSNFRPSWWHNRDYGVFVANPFGRAAMKQGPPSMVRVPKGEPFRLAFTAIIHEGDDFQSARAYDSVVKSTR